ncbi:MAG: hypothetical protein ACYTG5_17465, partial [Planctomycetota bacterium]
MKWPLDSRIVLLALLILGLALRLDPAMEFWINGDEGIYYRAVHLDWAGFWQQVIGNAHHRSSTCSCDPSVSWAAIPSGCECPPSSPPASGSWACSC